MPFVVRSQPCWLVLSEGDWLGCGGCWGRAVWLAVRVWGAELEEGADPWSPPPVIELAEVPHVELSCAGCGRWWVDPWTGLPLHGISEGEALERAAVEFGWTGELCSGCAGGLAPC